MRRRLLQAAAVVFILAASSCGLPTYSYLYPPSGVEDRSTPLSFYDLIFNNAYENNSSVFLGYEIFYKIYDPLAPDTSATLYLTDKSSISDTSSNTILENKGFKRLFTSNSFSSISHSSTKPSFPIDGVLLDQDFKIRLNFYQGLGDGDSFDAQTYNTPLSFSQPVYLYRYVKNPQGVSVPKFFDTDDFDIGDDDMPDSAGADDAGVSGYYLYISFYAYSYGRDIEDVSKSIYSVPVYLGTLRFEALLTNNY